MSRLHEGHDVALAVEETRRELASLGAWIRRNAPADAPLAHDALQEAVEACLLYALSMDRRLPGPDELQVEPEAYLLGLADTVGEVRRIVLHDLSAGRVDEAERRLLTLEALYRILLRFETTRAILPLKPKQDAARGMLEKTRGEVTMARLLVRARLPAAPGSEGGHR
jgi:translin